jgi:hypothetical protein
VILEALANADQGVNAIPDYYQLATIHRKIALTSNGEIINDIQDFRSKKNKDVVQYLLPFLNRTVDIKPFLASDNASYVLPYLMYVRKKNKGKNLDERHPAFVKVLQRFETVNDFIPAILRFLEQLDEVHALLMRLLPNPINGNIADAIISQDNDSDEIIEAKNVLTDPAKLRLAEQLQSWAKVVKEEDRIVFEVDGEIVGNQPTIIQEWQKYVPKLVYKNNDETSQSDMNIKSCCLVCGSPIGNILNANILKVTAGKDLVSMIPVDKEALYAESHNLKQGENIPICVSCSVKMTQNYKTLHNNSVKFGNTEYLIISKQLDAVHWLLENLDRPDEEHVKSLLSVSIGSVSAISSNTDVGRKQAQQIRQRQSERGMMQHTNNDAAHFDYDEHFWLMFATAPSPGRGWFYGKEYGLNQIRDRIVQWFAWQRELDGENSNSYPISVRQALLHLYPKMKKGDKKNKEPYPDQLYQQVIQNILDGTKLSKQLLFLAVVRNQASGNTSGETKVTRERAFLIYTILRQHKGDDFMSNSIGYTLGRVLSIVNEAQSAAIGKVGSPISNQLWSGMSTIPGLVFSDTMGRYQTYIAKLHSNGKQGTAVYLENKMSEAMSQLPDQIPTRLAIEEQAAFAVGYYQQERIRFTKKISETTTPYEDEQVTLSI